MFQTWTNQAATVQLEIYIHEIALIILRNTHANCLAQENEMQS